MWRVIYKTLIGSNTYNDCQQNLKGENYFLIAKLNTTEQNQEHFDDPNYSKYENIEHISFTKLIQ